MKVRAQVSTVFHLDKCIGCHTCSLACKNLWTDRRGTEYMWWNNVETKPGTGYPTLYEDQSKYRGGWVARDGRLRLAQDSRAGELLSLFHNPSLPRLDDYYEPWTYRYRDVVDAEQGADQPAARPISAITGRPIDVEAGPNWDDDLGGSPVYAASDPNLAALDENERRQLLEFERLVFFYLPRICNHCLNPGCLGACPAGAIYKRGEDGIVLISQRKCRAWRMCVSGCPYKKTYYNWSTGKSEKCILCYPRQETQQAPGCMHACVGRIRYLGVLLYDADRIEQAALAANGSLVDAQRALILDPFDEEVARKAAEDGVHEQIVEAARRSPVYQFVKVWKLALPHHPEWRTLPMLFYVPPLLPVAASVRDGRQELAPGLFTSLEHARMPLRYMARLFSADNLEAVSAVFRKLQAVRLYYRARTVGDVSEADVQQALADGATTPPEVEAIYHLTSIATFHERFVIPPFLREEAIAAEGDTLEHQQAGEGFLRPARRGL
jgi:nitrate reductase / nitrite oxidoreductase, beta subunit